MRNKGRLPALGLGAKRPEGEYASYVDRFILHLIRGAAKVAVFQEQNHKRLVFATAQ